MLESLNYAMKRPLLVLYRKGQQSRWSLVRTGSEGLARLWISGVDLVNRAAERHSGRRLDERLARLLLKRYQLKRISFGEHGRETPYADVVHCIGGLGPGGAERQLVGFVQRLRERGLERQAILCINPPQGDTAHLLARAQDNAAFVKDLGWAVKHQVMPLLAANEDTVEFILGMHPAVRYWVLYLWIEFSLLRPRLVHCWLDHSNIWGGLAALLAGTPRILLSTRNVNPTHFPYLSQPWMLPFYRQLAASSRVGFVNNSEPGAEDYARWIGIPKERIPVVLNGIDFNVLPRPSETAILDARNALTSNSGDKLVVGAFRLSEEKQPILFVQVATDVLKAHPQARVALLGVGPYKEQVESCIVASGFQDRIMLLGRRSDMAEILSCADVVLHTAKYEGSPNILMEAQHFGTPVVATKAGGTIHVVADGSTGYLLDAGDRAGLAARVLELLNDPHKARRMGQAGSDYVHRNLTMDRMVDATLAIQKRMIADSEPRDTLPGSEGLRQAVSDARALLLKPAEKVVPSGLADRQTTLVRGHLASASPHGLVGRIFRSFSKSL